MSELNTRSFTFRNFYYRRLKRIFPALITALIVTFSLGYFLLLEDELALLGKHIAAGSAFVSNIVLYSESGYFDTSSNLKPLLHLWSLGVEEQFYFVWPLLLFMTRERLKVSALMVAGVLLISFTLNLLLIDSNPAGTFYLLHTRVWELALGCAAAHSSLSTLSHQSFLLGANKFENILHVFLRLISPIIKKRIGLFAEVTFLTSIGLIGVSVFCLNDKIKFPGFYAFLPAFGAFLAILSGSKSRIAAHLLGNKALVFVGLISYPLYLFHWPLLSFLEVTEIAPVPGVAKAAALGLSFVLAVLTYYFVEKPIRTRKTPIVLKLCLHNAALLILGIFAYLYSSNFSFHKTVKHKFSEVSYPNIEYCKSLYPFTSDSYCGISSKKRMPSVAILGDSHARAFFEGLANKLEARKITIVGFGRGGCPPFLGIDRLFDSVPLKCDEVFSKAVEVLSINEHIKTVILAGAFSHVISSLYITTHGRDSAKTESRLAFGKGLDSMLEKLALSNKRVILLNQVPELPFTPKDCITRPVRLFTSQSHIENCSTELSYQLERSREHTSLLQAILRKHPSVQLIEPFKYFCTQSKCSFIMDNELLYFDTNHINSLGSNYVSMRLMQDIAF